MRRKRNITLNSQNITLHFTGKEKIVTLSLIIIMLSFANITFTSALSYQSSVGVGFTFNPTLSVNISPSDLVISNLTPGTIADSNNITVSVATNATYGYILSVVMNGNNNDLAHTNGTDVFSSIATNSSLPSLTTNNTWGYSYKLSNDANWNNYSGLSTETSKTLVDSNDQTAMPIDFKIGAKAASTQASGMYTGVINFTAVTKYAPLTLAEAYASEGKTMVNGFYTMQDMTSTICNKVEAIGTQLQVLDKRDNKLYWIAKLADNHCWMTQNLDIAGGTEITSELSDIPENYTLPTANGFLEGNKLPASSRTGFNNNTQAYVYNTNNSTSNCSTPGCYSYYSWTAATAGSGIDISSANIDAPYSICPKNWHLPSSGNRQPYADYSDFYNLAISYGMDINTVSQDTPNFYNQAGPNTTPSFLLSGYYNSSQLLDIGKYGYYWSATTASREHAVGLYFSEQRVETTSVGRRMLGASIRCVAK